LGVVHGNLDVCTIVEIDTLAVAIQDKGVDRYNAVAAPEGDRTTRVTGAVATPYTGITS
jgi:hypothetical protein